MHCPTGNTQRRRTKPSNERERHPEQIWPHLSLIPAIPKAISHRSQTQGWRRLVVVVELKNSWLNVNFHSGRSLKLLHSTGRLSFNLFVAKHSQKGFFLSFGVTGYVMDSVKIAALRLRKRKRSFQGIYTALRLHLDHHEKGIIIIWKHYQTVQLYVT